MKSAKRQRLQFGSLFSSAAPVEVAPAAPHDNVMICFSLNLLTLALYRTPSSFLPSLLLVLISSSFIVHGSAHLDGGEITNDERQGFVGCLFTENLCNPDEVCYDDLAFGRCVSLENQDSNDLYRFDTFSADASDFLELELNQLKESGLTWNDIYSQCIIQTALNAIRYNSEFDSSICNSFIDESEVKLEKRTQEVEEEQQQPPVQKSFKVWTDDPEDPHALFYKASAVADQSPDFYMSKQQDGGILIEPQDSAIDIVSEDKDDESESISVPAIEPIKTEVEEEPKNEIPENGFYEEVFEPADFLLNYEVPIEENLIPAEDFESKSSDMNDEEEEPTGGLDIETRALETPVHLQGIDETTGIFNRHKFGQVKRSQSSDTDTQDEVQVPDQRFLENSGEGNPEFFYIPSGGDSSGGYIFSRNERFDVKKPGPFFPNSANNFFLNKIISEEEGSSDAEQDQLMLKDPFGPRKTQNLDAKGQIEVEQPVLAPVKDKRLLPVVDSVVHDRNEGNNYVHMQLNNRLQTWMQGSEMISRLAKELGIPEDALTERLIEDQHVQFRVEPNPQNIDAQQMVEQLGQNIEITKRVEDQVGVDIHRVVAGHQNEYQNAMFTGAMDPNLLLGITVAMATAGVLVIAVLGLVLIKRRRKQMRLKQNQIEQEEEDSRLRDQYSQLCRDWSSTTKPASQPTATDADIGTNQNTEAKTTPSATKKVSSRDNSKDIEGSNRSSTSSWPDEPTASNMDISTGHMVLAYMEDHLKNKQRLEQEWVALCGYEAEPCATTVAFKAENKKKNRYPDKLPYDHNRVIVNALLNKNNSDYINASTVTDHDPRNPPYIVTQGPLSQTVADFWQMVWEQGCVVIVMLTRLQDNGYHLCHRYWPEEGSEKYHIFEVHLVSEHVWCDDYLVRSVYLKNTRTGETRTVTQFHFRSWPAHGVPTSTKALLEFRRKVNKSYRGRSCPIIVHCSDGVGRAGTYILIDMVLNRMAKGCKEIDIAATLEHIRDQRGGMVQSRQQFEFCLMAVAEEVHAILKALPQ